MEDIHAIKPLIETPILTPGLVHLFWVFLGVLVLFAALLIFYYFWKKRRLSTRKEAAGRAEEEESRINRQEIARHKLREARKHIASGEYKLFHLKASEAVREFIACVYGDNFIDMTTREITKSKNLPDKVRALINDFFRSSDLAKFANANQRREAAEQAYGLAELVLNNKT